MASEKTLAIVIRLVEFSESSYVATLFTEDFGKITGLAKGARRPKSAFENALDLLAISRVVFIRKSSESMDLLTEARLERPFRVASRDLERLYAGYYVAELLQALTDQRDPHPSVFRAARQTLDGLNNHSDVATSVLRFELLTLRNLGHLPSLDDCVECGRPLAPGGERVAFGLVAGGVLCPQCKVGRRPVVALRRRAVDALRQLSNDQGNEDFEEIDRSVRGELRGLMTNYVSHLLGHRLRMSDFLSTLR
jgi:DNA repair protein RecO (recombination protein O)